MTTAGLLALVGCVVLGSLGAWRSSRALRRAEQEVEHE